jgi:cold-inducible RNA-binding protein
MRLYVGNLSYSTTETELREMFAGYGEVASLRIITDADSGRSKGFGFVEFASDEHAKAAMTGLNGKEIGGRAIVVNEARPRPERTGGGGGGGRRGGGGGGGYGGGRGGYGGGRDRY